MVTPAANIRATWLPPERASAAKTFMTSARTDTRTTKGISEIPHEGLFPREKSSYITNKLHYYQNPAKLRKSALNTLILSHYEEKTRRNRKKRKKDRRIRINIWWIAGILLILIGLIGYPHIADRHATKKVRGFLSEHSHTA